MRRSEKLVRKIAVLAAMALPLVARGAGGDEAAGILFMGLIVIVAVIVSPIISYYACRRIFRGEERDIFSWLGMIITFLVIMLACAVAVSTGLVFLLELAFGT